ncbi:MAG: hypothetical protein NZ739_04275 [Verrucomicrobiae bacterium]|nr:hypothetical protein [Verrucomicrobiae bacterium]MCX7721502.1 hypothetical protein [Verrucomicrobiae bacterium]MDW7980093.1 hypothetical protein [Verrucomicrobiales bacterium]
MTRQMVAVLSMLFGLLALAGLAVLVRAVFTAPWGYQDQTGFHYGFPPSQLVD